MLRTKILSCAIAAGTLAAGSPLSGADLDRGIVVFPESPTNSDTLDVRITAFCATKPVQVLGSSVEVSPGLIRIETQRSCGVLQATTLYTHIVRVPPVDAGLYEIEYWVTGTCPCDSPIEASAVVVSETVPIDQNSWGGIKGLYSWPMYRPSWSPSN